MAEFQSNPCIRCGRERVKDKERIVSLDSRKTKITTYVCPDKECQKIVEQQLAAKEKLRLSFSTRKAIPPNRKK